MNNQNLNIITSGARARELGAKGGAVKSVKKSIAARIRELKKKGLTNDMQRHFVQLLENPDICDLDLLIAIQRMREKGNDKDGKPIPLSIEEKRVYVVALQKWKDSRHGRKDNRKPDVGPTFIQQNLTIEMKEEMIKDLIGGEVIDANRTANSEEDRVFENSLEDSAAK